MKKVAQKVYKTSCIIAGWCPRNIMGAVGFLCYIVMTFWSGQHAEFAGAESLLWASVGLLGSKTIDQMFKRSEK